MYEYTKSVEVESTEALAVRYNFFPSIAVKAFVLSYYPVLYSSQSTVFFMQNLTQSKEGVAIDGEIVKRQKETELQNGSN